MEYTIDNFVESLIQKKGITGLSDDIMAQMKSDLVERAQNMINAEVLKNMPEESLEAFERKLDEGDTEEISNFCQKHISNFDEVVARALVNLQQIYLADTME